MSIHVAGSRHALIGAALLALVPAACIAAMVFMFITWHADDSGSWHVGVVELIAITAIAGVAILPCLAAASMCHGLMRTGFRRVTLDVDAAQLHLLAFGYGRPRRMSWGREVVLDVIVHHGGGAWLDDLHIILGGEPPVALLGGARKAELEFISSELRRALNIDVRRSSVAGWWGDESEATDKTSADDVRAADTAMPVLDYAPEPTEHPFTERSAVQSRVLIPPASPRQLWQVAWPILALCTGLAIVNWWQWSGVVATWWPIIGIVCIYAVGFGTSMLARLLDCFRHRRLELDASEVTLTTRMALGLGETVKRWPSQSVRDIVADGKSPGAAPA